MNFVYLIPRLVRHFMPETLARYLLKRRWLIQPGLESNDPIGAANRYIQILANYKISIQGKRILVFGYGGRLAIGVELLKRGAAHVVLCDHFISLDHERNQQLLPQYENYLIEDGGLIKPRAEFITLLHGDIRDLAIQKEVLLVDCVLSNSVYEHLHDVDGITHALAGLTVPNGVHLHFVDLRDHYFKYPFEMLTYSSRIWTSFLNPTSNLNRFRLLDYKNIFERYFQRVEIDVIERLEKEFEAIHSRVRPEFLSGDIAVDSVSLIQIFTEKPGIAALS